MNNKFLRLAASGLVTAGTAVGLNALNATVPVDFLSLKPGQNSQQALAQDVEEATNVRVYREASPAVVSIRAGSSTGSGSIISPDGLVLTNAHVVQQARTVTVILSDGREFEGSVVAFGENGLDLAAVRIQGQRDLPTIRLARPNAVEVGQRAFAIGNPFGQFQNTFTVGIVSRIDQNRGLIQTDAAINPGNSGGPLLNSQGELIGVNSSIFTTGRTSGNIGIGFAIATDRVQSFLTAVQEGRAPREAQRIPFPGTENARQLTLNGAPVQGTLDRNSSVLPADNSFFNAYTFDARAGQRVVIDMISDEIDAYLILLAPDGRDLAQNDDGGSGTNARLELQLPSNGTYTILANSFGSGESGRYNLRLSTSGTPSSSSSPSPPSRPPVAPMLSPSVPPGPPRGSSPPSSPTSQEILRREGVLGQDSAVLPGDGSLYNEYDFEGRAGQSVTIDLESDDFDTYLILLGPDGQVVAANDDISPDNLNSRISITLPRSGTYRAIANSYDATGRGRYVITIR